MNQQPPNSTRPPRRPGNETPRDWNGENLQQGGGQERSPYGRDRDYEPEYPERPYDHQERQDWRRQAREWEHREPQRDEPWPQRPRQYGHGPQQDQDWQRDPGGQRAPQRNRYGQQQGQQPGRGYGARDAGRDSGYPDPRHESPQRQGSTQPWREDHYPRSAPPRAYGNRPAPGAPYSAGGNPGYAQDERYGADFYRPEQYAAGGSWDRAADDYAPQQTQPNHRGRAPKGYVRSDERIREDLCETLSEDMLVDASDVSVSVQSGIVTLEGSVRDRAQKHRVEDIADACGGVQDVHNRLKVARP